MLLGLDCTGACCIHCIGRCRRNHEPLGLACCDWGESGGGEFPKLRCWHPLELRGCCCRTVFSSQSLSFPHAVRLLLQIWVFTTTGEYQLRLPPGITFIFSLSLVAGVGLNPLEVEGGGGFLGFTTTSSSSSLRQRLVLAVLLAVRKGLYNEPYSSISQNFGLILIFGC